MWSPRAVMQGRIPWQIQPEAVCIDDDDPVASHAQKVRKSRRPSTADSFSTCERTDGVSLLLEITLNCRQRCRFFTLVGEVAKDRSCGVRRNHPHDKRRWLCY